MTQNIALLGSTGSIGTQTLDIISKFPDKFRIDLLAAGNNVNLLASQAKKFRPRYCIIGNAGHYPRLKELLSDTDIEVLAGNREMEQAVAGSEADTVLAAIVGYSGLRSTIAAVKNGKKLALANKETLVVAGSIITELARNSGSSIVPVDSEHSAIFQCLTGEEPEAIEKITLTASGGPFLGMPLEKLAGVKPSDALKHPNWSMGDKVTIDSATMMNKGLEVIEAHWLFDLDPWKIEVTIHPQSIIHSFVHFVDGSVKAQLGMPDMRLPILYALSHPERYKSDLPRLDFTKCASFTFIEPDKRKFRSLSLAYSAIREGGNKPCVLNAANEIAVKAFLNGRLGFTSIAEVVEEVLIAIPLISKPSLEELEETDTISRELAEKIVQKTENKR